MRTLSKLRPANKILSDFFVFDTETGKRYKNGKIKYELEARPEKFIFGVVYSHNFTKVIYSVEDFKTEFLKPEYKNKKVFCHNAEYDLNVLYGNIYQLDNEAIFNGKFIQASNGNCIFADSTNIFPYSAKMIGEKLGLEKLELGTGKGKKVNGIPANDINYCIRDCEIIYEALIGFFEQVGEIKITQASLSLAYFRRYFLKHAIKHNDLNKFFWNSYAGGRCEAFKIGETNAYVYDINSMYPYVMKQIKFPNPQYMKYKKGPVRLDKYIHKFEGCAHVKVRHFNNWFGYLPVKKDNKLIFPVGTFSGWYNFNELRFAINRGYIEVLETYELVYSFAMESPFSDFVDINYKARFESNNDMEITRIKVFMNSLYGKFAQKIEKECIYIEDIKKQMNVLKEYEKAGRLLKIIPFNSERSDMFIEVTRSNTFDLNYAIPSFASYITSGARIELLKGLEKFCDYRPVYCDTDSIFTELPLPESFTDTNKTLGAWKLEDKRVNYIAGLKNYSYISGEKVINKIKGVPKKAVKIADQIYEYTSLIKTREGLRRGLLPGKVKTVVKQLKHKYNKRIVLENGQTLPIEL